MAITFGGTVKDRQHGQGIGGLWVELRARERVVARAAEPTNDDGSFTFAVDDQAIHEVLGEEAAELSLAVRRDGGGELAIAEPAVIAWPLETDAVELVLAVELPDEV